MTKTQIAQDLQVRIDLFKNASGEFELKCARTILEKMPRLLVALFGTTVEAEDWAVFFKPTGFKFNQLSRPKIELQEVLDALSRQEFEQLPIYREFVDLHGEALFGLIDVSDTLHDYHSMNLPSAWEVYIEKDIPRDWYAGTELEAIMEARRCRRVIDNEPSYEGQTISVEGLATLTSLNIKTLRNILSREGSGIHLVKTGAEKGRIEAHVAKEWLKTRPEYLPTISLSVSIALNEGLLKPQQSESGPFQFVPAAADGSTFSPGSTVNGRYEIGPKGQDLSFADYAEALLALQAMAEPVWKRTDKADRVRVTTATHWLRVSESSFQKGGKQ